MLIAYDRDAAGDAAAEKLAAMGMEVVRVVFPKGMDANEYALKVQPAAQSLGLVLRQAQWLAGVGRGGELGGVPPAAPASLEAPEPARALTEASTTEPESKPEALSFFEAEAATKETGSESEDEPISEPERDETASMMETEPSAPTREPESLSEPEAVVTRALRTHTAPPQDLPRERITRSEVRHLAD